MPFNLLTCFCSIEFFGHQYILSCSSFILNIIALKQRCRQEIKGLNLLAKRQTSDLETNKSPKSARAQLQAKPYQVEWCSRVQPSSQGPSHQLSESEAKLPAKARAPLPCKLRRGLWPWIEGNSAPSENQGVLRCFRPHLPLGCCMLHLHFGGLVLTEQRLSTHALPGASGAATCDPNTDGCKTTGRAITQGATGRFSSVYFAGF